MSNLYRNRYPEYRALKVAQLRGILNREEFELALRHFNAREDEMADYIAAFASEKALGNFEKYKPATRNEFNGLTSDGAFKASASQKKEIGKRIRYVRQHVLGLSRNEFALAKGFSEATVKNWETGCVKNFSIKMIEELTYLFESLGATITANWLLTGKSQAEMCDE